MEVVEALVRFSEVSPEDEEPPAEWVASMGAKKARRYLRVARMGHIPKNQAPIGLQVALEVTKVERKVRSAQPTTQNTLNIMAVQMPKVSAYFPEKEVTDDER